MSRDDRHVYAARVRRFIERTNAGQAPEAFERLALDLSAWQRQRSPVLAKLSDDTITQWQQIPAVPVALFRHLDIDTMVTSTPTVCFETSGTTGLKSGKHRLLNTVLYDFNAMSWAQRHIDGPYTEVISLVENRPSSSLAHMIQLFPTLRTQATVSSWVHNNELNIDGLVAHLAQCTSPVFVAATAFALAELLDHVQHPLPPSSTIMVTGGFKGRKTSYDDVALYAAARTTLNPSWLLTEYGMCELSSQLWGIPGSPYRPPPWLRPLAIDPITGAPLPPEESGQLRFYDLCNIDSTIGIETLDHGIVHSDGSVTLLGRLPGAAVRGCSLQLEHIEVVS